MIEPKDRLLPDAKEAAEKAGYVSAVHLQRVFGISLRHAWAIIAQMIGEGFCEEDPIPGTGRRRIIELVE